MLTAKNQVAKHSVLVGRDIQEMPLSDATETLVLMILVDQTLIASLGMTPLYAHVLQVMLEILSTNGEAVKLSPVLQDHAAPMLNVTLMEEQRSASVQEDILEIHILIVVLILVLPDHAQTMLFVRIQEMQPCVNAHRPIQEIHT